VGGAPREGVSSLAGEEDGRTGGLVSKGPQQAVSMGAATGGVRSRDVGVAEARRVRPAENPRVPGVPPLRVFREKSSSAAAPTYHEAVAWADNPDPESSSMGAARGAPVEEAGNVALARQVARREEEAREEQVAATSKDAEFAMLLVAEEAREKGIDREATLQAQGGDRDGNARSGEKGKEVARETEGLEEQAFGWERRLSAGDWRGAADLAPITLQPGASGVAVASQAYTHALVCFADGRSLVSATERAGLEGTPDWVDNSHTGHLRCILSWGIIGPNRNLSHGAPYHIRTARQVRCCKFAGICRTRRGVSYEYGTEKLQIVRDL
jgi:hypothetical protein